jgi:hypothetical protein
MPPCPPGSVANTVDNRLRKMRSFAEFSEAKLRLALRPFPITLKPYYSLEKPSEIHFAGFRSRN